MTCVKFFVYDFLLMSKNVLLMQTLNKTSGLSFKIFNIMKFFVWVVVTRVSNGVKNFDVPKGELKTW